MAAAAAARECTLTCGGESMGDGCQMKGIRRQNFTQIYVMNNVISGETVKSKKLCQVCIRGVMTMVDNASGVEGANGTNGRSAFS